jgi:hypothetical protein
MMLLSSLDIGFELHVIHAVFKPKQDDGFVDNYNIPINTRTARALHIGIINRASSFIGAIARRDVSSRLCFRVRGLELPFGLLPNQNQHLVQSGIYYRFYQTAHRQIIDMAVLCDSLGCSRFLCRRLVSLPRAIA